MGYSEKFQEVKMLKPRYHLGLDTSNYTSSIAVVDSDRTIIFDQRRPLPVEPGSLGLRQSEAFFLHSQSLPDMIKNLFDTINKDYVASISVSNKPRPLEDSYMPVFRAGENFGKILSMGLGKPLYPFSHQEGHIEAGLHQSELNSNRPFIALHLSGGTSEILAVDKIPSGYEITILGATDDISFGQLLDRVGVALSLAFPCGRLMDEIAGTYTGNSLSLLTPIRINDLNFNLSGIETQCRRAILAGCDQKALVNELFQKIGKALCHIIKNAANQTHASQILLVGGVSASSFLRIMIKDYFDGQSITPVFGSPVLSADNAVGIALLGLKSYQSR
jgi:N6-L-threonylcarbamoyladenine synthase